MMKVYVKKMLLLLVVLVMGTSVCACGGGESDFVKQAKQHIDKIYNYTEKLAVAEMERKELSSKSNLTQEENEKLDSLKWDCILAEEGITVNTMILERCYKEMSEEERDIIRKYVDSAYDDYLDSILNGY